MPKVWAETMDAHRRAVREAILNATANLAHERGILSVTMSQVAEASGIGRATLYKYFPDLESIVRAWHERQVGAHLEQLVEVSDREGGPLDRLQAVLEAYALISHEHHGTEPAAMLHRGEHVHRAHAELTALVRDLIVQGAAVGDIRSDVPAGELAAYCLHALAGAAAMPSKAAVRRLVAVTLAGLAA